jgi:hypothetical protein
MRRRGHPEAREHVAAEPRADVFMCGVGRNHRLHELTVRLRTPGECGEGWLDRREYADQVRVVACLQLRPTMAPWIKAKNS